MFGKASELLDLSAFPRLVVSQFGSEQLRHTRSGLHGTARIDEQDSHPPGQHVLDCPGCHT